jgi:voltage-gated potassium channel
LIMELVLILSYPFTLEIGLRFDWFRLLAVLIFAAALYAALGRGRVTLIAFLLGTPAIVIHVANVAGHVLALQTASMILAIVFLVFVTRVFIWTVMTDATVTADTLVGAVAAYLLIGITYGLGYGLLEQLIPGSFRDTVQPGRTLHPAEFIFFSFVTLTTVGYGDIIPWGGHARSLVILESVTGIMYPAVFIGRLIGLHISRRNPAP